MDYITRDFCVNVGFVVDTKDILSATNMLNSFLLSLPPSLYRNLDLKTQGSMVGALFCSYLADTIKGAIVNPIEKGYPDIIPSSGSNATEAELRKYPMGMEIKGTVGGITKGLYIPNGKTRIDALKSIVWQAHHKEVNNLLGFVWDYCNKVDGFYFPAITAIFYSGNLCTSDWGKISGTEGRNTKVTSMLKSGRNKMGKGMILMYDSPTHISKYKKILGIPI